MTDAEAINLGQVNAIIKQHMFPQCAKDARHSVHFDNWEFSGFAPDPSSTINLHGVISARYRRDGTVHQSRIAIWIVDIEKAKSPKELFSHMDAVLMVGIKDLISDAMGDHYLL